MDIITLVYVYSKKKNYQTRAISPKQINPKLI